MEADEVERDGGSAGSGFFFGFGVGRGCREMNTNTLRLRNETILEKVSNYRGLQSRGDLRGGRRGRDGRGRFEGTARGRGDGLVLQSEQSK